MWLRNRSIRVAAAATGLSVFGRPASGYPLDVRDPVAVEKAVSDFSGQHGSLDVVVSGAAGNFPAAALDMSPNGFRAVVDIDLLGTFHVLRAAYSYLTRPGACAINISPIPKG